MQRDLPFDYQHGILSAIGEPAFHPSMDAVVRAGVEATGHLRSTPGMLTALLLCLHADGVSAWPIEASDEPELDWCRQRQTQMGIVVAAALIASTEGRSGATSSVGNRRIRWLYCDRPRSPVPPAPLASTFATRPMRRVPRPDESVPASPMRDDRHGRSLPFRVMRSDFWPNWVVIYGTAPGNCPPTLITTARRSNEGRHRPVCETNVLA